MIQVGLSTISVFPKGVEDGFRLAHEAGYDGVEVMVTTDAKTRSPERLLELSERYHQPIMAIHAPVVLLTTFVWGRDPFVKLDRSAELAVSVGAPTVVVHPPFRWQGKYAKTFEDAVRQTEQKHGVEVAVENMFPWSAGGIDRAAYLPGIDPSEMDVDHATLDFSHCALAKRDSMQLALDLGDRLRHLHLTDGVAAEEGRVFDEHLIPGHGNEPVAEVLLLQRRRLGRMHHWHSDGRARWRGSGSASGRNWRSLGAETCRAVQSACASAAHGNDCRRSISRNCDVGRRASLREGCGAHRQSHPCASHARHSLDRLRDRGRGRTVSGFPRSSRRWRRASEVHVMAIWKSGLNGPLVGFGIAAVFAIATLVTFAAHESSQPPLRVTLLLLAWAVLVPMTVATLGWALWAVAQTGRIARLKAADSSALVIPAYSSDMLLYEAAERGDAIPRGYVGAMPILVVSASGIEIWSGWVRPEVAMRVQASEIESITVGRTGLSAGYASPTIDMRLRGASDETVLAFAPMHQGWRTGFLMNRRSTVERQVDLLKSVLT